MEQRVLTFKEVIEAENLLDKLVTNKITRDSYLHLYD